MVGKKKKGIGKGRWKGFGGKVEQGEKIEQAMQREVREECGLLLKNFEKRGVLKFVYQNNGTTLETHIFCARDFEGDPIETEEMRPQWFSVEEIPFAEMWPDDKYWFPLFLEGKSFNGRFLFRDHDTILEYSLE